MSAAKQKAEELNHNNKKETERDKVADRQF